MRVTFLHDVWREDGPYGGIHPDCKKMTRTLSIVSGHCYLGKRGRGEGNIMQCDIEHDTPLKSTESSYPLSAYGRQSQQKLSLTTWHLILILGDNALFVVLLALVLLLIPHLDLKPRASNYELNPWHLRMLWGSLALVSWSIAVRITRTQDLPEASNRLRSPLSVLFALALMGICWRVLTYPLLTAEAVYPQLLLFFLTLAGPTFSVWRVALATAINLPRFRRQAVIIGTNTAAKTIAKALQGTKYPIAQVLGYISEAPIMEPHDRELPVLGDKNALRHLTQNGVIDMIIMAIDYKTSPELFQEAIEATQLGISLVPMTVVYERSQCKIPVEYVGDQWYLALPIEVTASALYLCWHKVIDTLFGLLGMLILGLIFPFMTLLIRLDSPGPIFYTQERLGHQGRIFYIRKFRSMYHNAEQPARLYGQLSLIHALLGLATSYVLPTWTSCHRHLISCVVK
jgi:hypothetical protein